MAFLSVRAAAAQVGKSTSSIRRLIYPILKTDDHPDRHLIEPSVGEAKRLRLAGVNFAWQVSEELLQRIPAAEPAADHSPLSGAGKAGVGGDADLLAMLRRELDIKNRQIAQQNDLIAKHTELVGGLSERLREGNVLIAALQQRLALTDGREEKPASFVDATPAPEPPGESGGPDAEPKGPKPPKKGFFARLFR